MIGGFMKLYEIAASVNALAVQGDMSVEVTGLCAESHKVKKGDLFFCYKGERFNSHSCAAQVAASGAVALVCEKKLNCPLPQIIVGDGREAMTAAARAFYGFSDKKLKIVAVTGTNGKTTTTYMLNSIFGAAGLSAGVIGTLGISFAGRFISPELTTPDPIYLHSVFKDMADCGVKYVFMLSLIHI